MIAAIALITFAARAANLDRVDPFDRTLPLAEGWSVGAGGEQLPAGADRVGWQSTLSHQLAQTLEKLPPQPDGSFLWAVCDVIIPPSWRGSRIYGAVQDAHTPYRLWVNGELLEDDQIDLSELLEIGEPNSIAIRFDWGDFSRRHPPMQAFLISQFESEALDREAYYRRLARWLKSSYTIQPTLFDHLLSEKPSRQEAELITGCISDGANLSLSHHHADLGTLSDFVFWDHDFDRDWLIGLSRIKPHIIIELPGVAELERLETRAFRAPRHDEGELQSDLTVWVSLDGLTWEKAWVAQSGAGSRVIDLSGYRARFIKLGRTAEGRSDLHLYRAQVFGKMTQPPVTMPKESASAQETRGRRVPASYHAYLKKAADINLATTPQAIMQQRAARTQGATASFMILYGLKFDHSESLEWGEMLYDMVLDSYVAQKHAHPNDRSEKSILNVFSMAPLARGTNALQKAGKLSRERIEKFRELAIHCQPYWIRGATISEADNWGGTIAFGAATVAFQIFPDDAEFAPAREALQQRWDQWLADEDWGENAPSYSRITLRRMLQISEIMGSDVTLGQRPGIAQSFRRVRDIVSPSGYIPTYGDEHFALGGQLEAVLLLKDFGKLLGDSSFAYVADKLWATRENAGYELTGDITEALVHCHLIDSIDDSFPASEQANLPLSHVIDRKVRRGEGYESIRDKIVLRTSNDPGASQVLLDVGRGGHGHYEKRPAIPYFETAGIPFLRTNKNTNILINNVVWVGSDDQDFPFGRADWEPDKWLTHRFPLDRRMVTDAGYLVFNQIHYMDLIGAGETELLVDNIRLKGPKKEVVLFDCESLESILLPSHWPKDQASPYSLVSDCSQGRYAIKIDPAMERYQYFAPKQDYFGLELPAEEFTDLLIDMKYKGKSFTGFLRWRESVRQGMPSDYLFGADSSTTYLPASLKHASVENRGGDAYGEVVWKNYLKADAQLRRRILLSDEGFLVVRDELDAGADLVGQRGGPLWQLLSCCDSGENWFTEPLAELFPTPFAGFPYRAGGSLTIVMEACDGRDIGLTSARRMTFAKSKTRGVFDRPITAHASEILESDRTSIFVTVFVPHRLEVSPQAVADTVSIVTKGETSSVTVQLSGKEVEVEFNDRSWQVTRSSNN